jgi:hypothetical protein
MTEIRYAIPILASLLVSCGKITRCTVDFSKPFVQYERRSPILIKIGGGVDLGAGRCDGNGRPGRGGREDLETGLGAPLEEKGDRSVIGMSAGANVDFRFVVAMFGKGRVLIKDEQKTENG